MHEKNDWLEAWKIVEEKQRLLECLFIGLRWEVWKIWKGGAYVNIKNAQEIFIICLVMNGICLIPLSISNDKSLLIYILFINTLYMG